MADTKLSALAAITAFADADKSYYEQSDVSKSGDMALERTFLVGPGFYPLDITALREIASDEIQNLAAHGGILALDSTPILERVATSTDKALRVVWGAGDQTEVQFPPVMMAPFFDAATDVTIHLLAKMNASGDTPTIDVQVFDAIGDTEMGGPTAALSVTLAELTVTLANADISGHPLGFFNISLVPGTHATQLVELYGAWMEFKRKAA